MCCQLELSGVPLVLHLLPLFIERLEEAKSACAHISLNLLENEHYPAPIEPWSEPPEHESEEVLMCPDPCSFTQPLAYLSIPYDQAKAEFFALFETQLSPELRAQTEVEKLFRSELALAVFLPKEWTGVNGIPPLELKYKDTMPVRIKPPARNINPKLLEATHYCLY